MNFKLIILYQNVWIANFNSNNIDRMISRGRTATKEILLTCPGVKKAANFAQVQLLSTCIDRVKG